MLSLNPILRRICSDDPAVANVPIADVIMASAAMPVVFPMRSIRNFNDGIANSSKLYIDGGSGTDMVPLFSLLNRYKLDQAYVITRQSEIGTRNSLPQWTLSIPILANTRSSTHPPLVMRLLLTPCFLCSCDDV
jgi:predicted acylesterase/phospholipase RssA